MPNEKRQLDRCKPGIDCSYAVRRGKMVCIKGQNAGCFPGELLEADHSIFHTEHLENATQSINKILSEIPKDSEGRTLSFITTRMGVMLTWVEHENESVHDANKDVDEVGITAAHDNDTLAKALNLKNYNSN